MSVTDLVVANADGTNWRPAATVKPIRTFRYVPYSFAQDQSAEPEYDALCVSGDDDECGEYSGVHPDPDGVQAWQVQHFRETGHKRFRRNFGDYCELTPEDADGHRP